MRFWNSLLILSGVAVLTPLTSTVSFAQQQQSTRPPLIITNAPLPEELRSRIYTKPVPVREISAAEVAEINDADHGPTPVSQRVNDLNNTLYDLQVRISDLSATLKEAQIDNRAKATEYYAAIATINAQLQSGTTPGNPRLLQKMAVAESNLDALSSSVVQLNQLAAEASKMASEAAFLLESARAAYGISGAVEEDHVRLAELEDIMNNTIVIIDRVLGNVNNDITRTSSYLTSERNNLRTLSLAVANGDLYGTNLSNRPFETASSMAGIRSPATEISEPGALSGPRPLAKIRFDRQDVDYEQPVYNAVSQALERYPGAQFDLVAVHPSAGNAAEVAIESTRARRNAERVLRTLTQMGLPAERISLSYGDSAEATASEVHIYIR